MLVIFRFSIFPQRSAFVIPRTSTPSRSCRASVDAIRLTAVLAAGSRPDAASCAVSNANGSASKLPQPLPRPPLSALDSAALMDVTRVAFESNEQALASVAPPVDFLRRTPPPDVCFRALNNLRVIFQRHDGAGKYSNAYAHRPEVVNHSPRRRATSWRTCR